MTHIIQKQILELTLDEGPEKLVRQDDMVQRFREEVLPDMDVFFNELVPEGTVWKIDKLEVDLGQVKPENLSKELIRHLKDKLLFDFQPGKGGNSLEVSTSQQSVLEQFLHFLKYGHFSWNANGITLEQMEKELPEVFQNSDQLQKAKVLQKLTKGRSLQRFTSQFSLEFQITLVLKLLEIQKLKTLFRFLRERLPQDIFRMIPKAAITAYASFEKANTPQTFITPFLRNLENEMAFSPQAKEKFRTQLLAKAKKEKGNVAKHVVEALQKLQEEKTATAREKKEAKIADNVEDTVESIYILNAGLVLLWPYLSRFFENLKLMDSGEFISRKAREKAICMLQFLANPETGITENLLPLNKILCGLDITDLVPTDEIEISREDADAGNELIKAVINNWPKIGNTSIQGFQTSFLQREGRLEKTEEGWSLKVEQRSFDMLLDSLPWSITLIKLPWMPKPLHVEW